MKELHFTITAEIEDRLAKVKFVTGEFVFNFEGPVSYIGEHALFRANVIYFQASETVTFELTKHAIREDGIVLEYEQSGSLIPDKAGITRTIESAVKQRFPLIWPALLSTLRSIFQ